MIAVILSIIILAILILYSPKITITDSTATNSRQPISVNCGPRSNSDLSVTITVKSFRPNEFLIYRFLSQQGEAFSGGFSTGSEGQNNVTINVGPHSGKFLLNFYKDLNSDDMPETGELLQSSNLVVPCQSKHFSVEFYRTHPQAIQDLFGMKSFSNYIKVGNNVLNTSVDATRILYGMSYGDTEDHFAAELLAATMNVLSGGKDECIIATISAANDFIKDRNYGDPQLKIQIGAENDHRERQMLSLTSLLKDYNENGCSRNRNHL